MKYDSARCMIVFQDKLYVGTGNDSGTPSGGQVWEYNGSTWDQVNDNGFGDTMNEAVHSLASDGSSLFAGVANTVGAGGKVFASVQAPIVTTQAVTGIGLTTATGNGTITDLGYSNPTAHGVVWNTAGTPTLADNSTDEGAAGATGPFTSSMTGLSPNTTYYVRAYATNTAGTVYGNEVSFATNVAITPSIPALNEWGLIIFLSLLIVTGCILVRTPRNISVLSKFLNMKKGRGQENKLLTKKPVTGLGNVHIALSNTSN